MARVSAVITTYNRTKYLRESVASIRAQSVQPSEIIVVDDASTDGAIETLKDDPIFDGVVFLRHHENQGLGGARNTGIKRATGDYILLHDDDDLLEPRLIETALDVMRRNPAVELFCCDAILIDSTGSILYNGRTFHEINGQIKRYPIESGFRSFEDIFLFSTISIGLVVKKQVFERVSYPLSRNVGDYEFQLQVAGHGCRIYYLHQPLAHYRIHQENASGQRWMVKICERKVVCLQDALVQFSALERLGWCARRRMADARMELGIAYLKKGNYYRGALALCQAVSGDPRQAADFARLAWRWLAKRIFGYQCTAQ